MNSIVERAIATGIAKEVIKGIWKEVKYSPTLILAPTGSIAFTTPEKRKVRARRYLATSIRICFVADFILP
jgi:hypothetical protein